MSDFFFFFAMQVSCWRSVYSRTLFHGVIVVIILYDSSCYVAKNLHDASKNERVKVQCHPSYILPSIYYHLPIICSYLQNCRAKKNPTKQSMLYHFITIVLYARRYPPFSPREIRCLSECICRLLLTNKRNFGSFVLFYLIFSYPPPIRYDASFRFS